MPGWSTEIANVFIRLSRHEGRLLGQSMLQELVYLANGHMLSITGQPLTNDRPVAVEFGPLYERLAEALAGHGDRLIDRELTFEEAWPDWPRLAAGRGTWSELDAIEAGIVELVYNRYVEVGTDWLSAYTAGDDSAWAQTFNEGSGHNHEIRHEWIKDQFDALRRSA